MRLFAILTLLVLAGAGCFPFDFRSEEMPPEEGSFARPPEISLSSQGSAVAGVEGSYCYQRLCVDKISPPMLVAESGLDFTPVSRTDLRLHIDAEVTEMSASLMDEQGNSVEGSFAELAFPDGEASYSVPPSVPAGDYYLIAFVRLEAEGDVSYAFPISIE